MPVYLLGAKTPLRKNSCVTRSLSSPRRNALRSRKRGRSRGLRFFFREDRALLLAISLPDSAESQPEPASPAQCLQEMRTHQADGCNHCDKE